MNELLLLNVLHELHVVVLRGLSPRYEVLLHPLRALTGLLPATLQRLLLVTKCSINLNVGLPYVLLGHCVTQGRRDFRS